MSETPKIKMYITAKKEMFKEKGDQYVAETELSILTFGVNHEGRFSVELLGKSAQILLHMEVPAEVWIPQLLNRHVLTGILEAFARKPQILSTAVDMLKEEFQDY